MDSLTTIAKTARVNSHKVTIEEKRRRKKLVLRKNPKPESKRDGKRNELLWRQ